MTDRSERRAFLFLAANTPWVYALAHSLLPHGAVTAMRLYDWANYRRQKPEWPETESAVRRQLVTMPQGYAGALEFLFRPLMRRIVDRERRLLRLRSGAEPVVICPYPYGAPWVRQVSRERLVYYNLDDYVLYDPARAARTLTLEAELVRRAGLTVCLSMQQTETLRARQRGQGARIEHFPLGVLEEFLNPSPEVPGVANTVGYVGNMTERVDWAFIGCVASMMPGSSFHFVGNASDGSVDSDRSPPDNWRAKRARTLARPNVVHEGPIPQSEVGAYYRRYRVNWMPYDVRHPFNIASCPTKIMDALASGRPFVSTRIPEVLLYPERVNIVSTPEDAVVKLRALLNGEGLHDSRAQIDFAASQTWALRARRFLELLPAGDRRDGGPVNT